MLGDGAYTLHPLSISRVTQRRREEIRRQRIESEQRRRDELREGYRRLKDVLPVSNQKSSKVSLLDRGMCSSIGHRLSFCLLIPFFPATTHIKLLETQHQQMAMKIAELEMETNRLRGCAHFSSLCLNQSDMYSFSQC